MLFVETSEFTKRLHSHLDDDGYAALQAFLSVHPNAGSIIPGSGGVRKLRWGSEGRGKRGGNRIIYYWLVAENRIYLLTLYGKAVKDDLTRAELAAWRKIVEGVDNA